MREYRKTHKLTDKQLIEQNEKKRKRYYELKKDAEWVEKNRMLHRKYAKEYRSKFGIRKILTKRHNDYYHTEKGEKAIKKARIKYETTHPERRQAWWITAYAKRIGRIKSIPCKVCG